METICVPAYPNIFVEKFELTHISYPYIRDVIYLRYIGRERNREGATIIHRKTKKIPLH